MKGKRKLLYFILRKAIVNIVKAYISSINPEVYITKLTKLDMQNYINTKKIKIDGVKINDIFNIVAIYNTHLAHCNIYLKGKIKMPYNIKISNIRYIDQYKKDNIYIVYDRMSYRFLIKLHEYYYK